MSKSRLEAFSDGVIAVIITIMVLELKVPHEASWQALVPAPSSPSPFLGEGWGEGLSAGPTSYVRLSWATQTSLIKNTRPKLRTLIPAPSPRGRREILGTVSHGRACAPIEAPGY